MSERPIVAITRKLVGDTSIEGAEVRLGWEKTPTREQVLGLVRGVTGVIPWVTDRIDTELLDAAGAQLKVVSNYAVGYDNIDLEACRARGIVVTNTPDVVTEGTANLAMGLIIAVARRMVEGDAFVRSGEWARHGPLGPDDFLGMDLAGRTLLIVGAGRIGYATALRAQAFGMKVAYVARSRKLTFEMSPLAAERVTFEDGLARADVVSVHTPLTEATRHLIDARALGLMKATAILINTARGPVVDEAALGEALAAKKLWGAGLDVFEREPEIHPGLVGLDNVVLAPHIGSGERVWREKMTRLACENVEAVLRGEEPRSRVV